MFVMRLLVLLLMSTCLVATDTKKKGKLPKDKQKQKHRQWLKHPLYLPPGKHFIDESIQPGKQNPKKQAQQMNHKTVVNGPNPFYQYRTGKTGFKILFYDPKGQADIAQIPAFGTKPAKAGSKMGQTGFKKFPMYDTKTGQAGYVPIPMYRTKTGKTGFKNFPLYDTKAGQADFGPIAMYGIKFGKKNFPMYRQSGYNQMPMYQMMPGLVPYNTPSAGIVPVLDIAAQPTQSMYLNSPTSPVQGIDAPLLAANQMNMMYPTGLTGETGLTGATGLTGETGLTGATGLTGFENVFMNQQQGFSLPGFPGLPLASPALQASEALAESVLGQAANAQAKSIISGISKQNDPSFTVSVDGVVRSVVKKGDSAVNLDAGGASISLSKKNKVLKQIKKKRQ